MMGTWKQWWVVLPMLVLAGCGGSSDSSDAGSIQIASGLVAQRCAELNGTTIGGAVVKTTMSDAANGNSAHCRFEANGGYMLDMIAYVPVDYQGRLYHEGGGGYDGKFYPLFPSLLPLNQPLAKGAIRLVSNGGTRYGDTKVAELTVDEQALLDYAYGAVIKTVLWGKAVTRSVSGANPRYTYFAGVSGGGRNAYVAAARFADQYDGIVAGSISMDMTGHVAANSVHSKAQVMGTMPTAAKRTAAYNAAISACDLLDGLKDGVIANYLACAFDPVNLQCGTPGVDPATCLSAAEVQAVRAIMSETKLASGRVVYSGYSWGNFAGVPSPSGTGFAALATGETRWSLPFNDLNSLKSSFDLERDYYVFGLGLDRKGLDIDMPGVARFLQTGKKLIAYGGSDDAVQSTPNHVRLWTQTKSLAGTAAASNTRFFVQAGGGHAFGGVGPSHSDFFQSIIDWVEKGIAPEVVEAANFTVVNDRIQKSWTMPACQHPKYPKYNGTGDPKSASSFTCTQ